MPRCARDPAPCCVRAAQRLRVRSSTGYAGRLGGRICAPSLKHEQSCLDATEMGCDCACIGLSHGSANTDS